MRQFLSLATLLLLLLGGTTVDNRCQHIIGPDGKMITCCTHGSFTTCF